MILVITAATSTYLLLTPRGKAEDDEWYWDYLDMKARGAIEILLDDTLLICYNLTGREAVHALFSREILLYLHVTSARLFGELYRVLEECTGNETSLHLEIRRGEELFSGGIEGEESVVRTALLSGDVEVRVAVSPLGGGL